MPDCRGARAESQRKTRNAVGPITANPAAFFTSGCLRHRTMMSAYVRNGRRAMSLSLAEHPFSNLARQAGKMMDQMQKGFYVYSADTWTPNVNLYETASTYLVCVDLAGVEKEKIDVEVADSRLSSAGRGRSPPTSRTSPRRR